MLNVPYNLNFISSKIVKDLVTEATANYMRKVIEYRELPENIKALEARFTAQGYTYKDPMTNDQFKEMAKKQLGEEKSKDPLEVNNLAEKLKTGYTNHYLEYYNKKQMLDRVPEIVKQFEDQITFLKERKPTLIQRIRNIFGI